MFITFTTEFKTDTEEHLQLLSKLQLKVVPPMIYIECRVLNKSQSEGVSSQMTQAINPTVSCHYSIPDLQSLSQLHTTNSASLWLVQYFSTNTVVSCLLLFARSYSYLPSCTMSSPFHQYQMILLGSKGKSV